MDNKRLNLTEQEIENLENVEEIVIDTEEFKEEIEDKKENKEINLSISKIFSDLYKKKDVIDKIYLYSMSALSLALFYFLFTFIRLKISLDRISENINIFNSLLGAKTNAFEFKSIIGNIKHFSISYKILVTLSILCFTLFLYTIISEYIANGKEMKIKSHYITGIMGFIFLHFGNSFVGAIIKFANMFLKMKSKLSHDMGNINFEDVGNVFGNFGNLENVSIFLSGLSIIIFYTIALLTIGSTVYLYYLKIFKDREINVKF